MYHFGLIGWPVEHSRSPALHQAALQALGLQGDYRLFPVPPGPEACGALGALVHRLRSGELHGLNVTLPHKTAMRHWANILCAPALATGAVNTLYLRQDRLVGDNTDAPGFLADVTRLFPSLFRRDSAAEPLTALVLGAGGAARAVVYALLQAGWRVEVAARRLDQAEALARCLSAVCPDQELSVIRLDGRSIAAAQEQLHFALLVNATPLGMAPHPEQTPWPAETGLPASAAVYDLVYVPRETALVKAARAAGLPAESGGGMLVEQAALAFERWTGQRPPREAMRQALAKELED